MQLIDGKKISLEIQQELKEELILLKQKNITPCLTIIQVGDNQASNVYVKNKLKLSESIGVNSTLNKLDENISEGELINIINKLNNDINVDGILLQLPLPKHIDENKMLKIISPNKDVDCFHIDNVGKL
jgi:methylenetetrahydrofolate dehydrogenase (NADP+)/methenyltetrahydrofolate cyclohydrolase